MSNTLKHTAGPWRVASGDNYEVESDNYPASYSHRFPGDDTGSSLACVGNRTEDFGEANANLIAAAPDLLAACETALSEIEYTQHNHFRLGALGAGALERTMRNLRAAIARATGEGNDGGEQEQS